MHSSQGYAEGTLILLSSCDSSGKMLTEIPPPSLPVPYSAGGYSCLVLLGPAHAASPVLCTQPVKAGHKATTNSAKFLRISLEGSAVPGGSLVAAAFFRSG